jgi:hypothetical protein
MMLLRPAGLLGTYEFPYLRQLLPALKAKLKSSSTKSEPGAIQPVEEIFK